ncbi:MAG: hypothetical protein M3Q42_06935 [Pseudomonadota bacterium]|nr:hypothetical protein [Pseudomonadota bacterium]
MTRFPWVSRLLLATAIFAASAVAAAQSLPVQVQASGNTATVTVVSTSIASTEVLVSFDEAFNLSPLSLGVSAELVSLSDPLLLARLPDPLATQIDSSLPLLITIEPPAGAGLAFNRTARVEIHTHALPYAVGSSYRIFKAPLNGAFRDITDEIAPGSVRARGTTGGFSQFLIVADARASSAIVAEKIARLRARFAMLPTSERGAFDAHLNIAETAVAAGNFANAIAAVDWIRARAAERAGTTLAEQWRALRDVENDAGEILAGAATLEFSIAYLRDFGD